MGKAAVLMKKDATYHLREEVTVRDLSDGDHRLDVWIPLPQNDANQQVLEVTAESDAGLSLHFDREWGNALLFGIPGRLVMGFALEEPVQGREACDVCGYHCWAEIYVAGLGWLPVDASCACKYGHAGFGTLDLNHVAFSRGRDILLEPPQGGERLLFFPSAYVEVDGAPCPGVERRLRFEPVGVSD